jgi:predicted dithiol-disulfide oxidoreductase (DUF899 family)
VKEKSATRLLDTIAAQRRELPMVKVQPYAFEGPEGRVSVLELFEGRKQ